MSVSLQAGEASAKANIATNDALSLRSVFAPIFDSPFINSVSAEPAGSLAGARRLFSG
jgi:hypothetical protein